MGLFEKIFGPRGRDKNGDRWVSLNNYESVAWRSWSGEAFESDLVRASADARARHISKLSIFLTGNGNPTLQRRLTMRPNSWQTWSQFLYRLSVIVDMQCTAFIVPVYTPTFDVVGISIVVPSDFALVDVEGTPWIRMRFANGNVASDELSHIGIMTKFQYLSDYFGTGNGALDSTLELIDIQRQGIKGAARNSSIYRFMATLSNFSKPEDLAKERERFTENNLKTDTGGGLLLFPSTYKDIKELDRKQYSVDADQQKVIENRVFNYFGVNEKILNNSATADDLDAFYEGAVEPFAIQLADVLTFMLFSEREQAAGDRVQFSADRLAYMSMQSKIQLIMQMSDRGEILQNEARRILNLPDLPGGNKTIIRGEYYYQEYDENGNLIEGEEDEDDGDMGDDLDDSDLEDDAIDGEEAPDEEDGDPDEEEPEEDLGEEDDKITDLQDRMQEELDEITDNMKEILDRANNGDFDDEEESGNDGK